MDNSKRLGMMINGISDISDQQSHGGYTHPRHKNTKYNSDTGCEFWSVIACVVASIDDIHALDLLVMVYDCNFHKQIVYESRANEHQM